MSVDAFILLFCITKLDCGVKLGNTGRNQNEIIEKAYISSRISLFKRIFRNAVLGKQAQWGTE
jgi:hypothetical protein